MLITVTFIFTYIEGDSPFLIFLHLMLCAKDTGEKSVIVASQLESFSTSSVEFRRQEGKGKFNSFLSSVVVPSSSDQKEDMS